MLFEWRTLNFTNNFFRSWGGQNVFKFLLLLESRNRDFAKTVTLLWFPTYMCWKPANSCRVIRRCQLSLPEVTFQLHIIVPVNPFIQNETYFKKFCSVNNAIFLKHVWPFFNIMNEIVNKRPYLCWCVLDPYANLLL